MQANQRARLIGGGRNLLLYAIAGGFALLHGNDVDDLAFAFRADGEGRRTANV